MSEAASIRSLLPSLDGLHERCNLSPALLASWAEAARVVLSEYWTSPALFSIGGEFDYARMLAFHIPTPTELASHRNRPDAVEMGAYALALAAVEDCYAFYAVERARELSGSDIIVSAEPESGILEESWRLEVSGTRGTAHDVRTRFKAKCDQIIGGDSILNGIVCVVGFRTGIVMLERIAMG